MWHMLPLLNILQPEALEGDWGRKKNTHMQTANILTTAKIARLADMMRFQDRSSTQPAISHRHKFGATTGCRTKAGMEYEVEMKAISSSCKSEMLGSESGGRFYSV